MEEKSILSAAFSTVAKVGRGEGDKAWWEEKSLLSAAHSGRETSTCLNHKARTRGNGSAQRRGQETQVSVPDGEGGGNADLHLPLLE